MCRHRSRPAAAPADVRMDPSSTKSTFGSTVICGCRSASSAGLAVPAPARALDGPVLRAGPAEVGSLDVAVDLHPVGCGGSGGLGGITLPLVAIALGEDAVVQQRLALGTAP